jgi:membrane carboxypeptidase/penicillin-binding protein
MGKTGTTNEFKDALFVGSTYGVDGITVAVRIDFDDNRSLGLKGTGGRLALPVFQELMLKVYRDGIVGPVPAFPAQMEQRITRYLQDLQDEAPALVVASTLRRCDWRSSRTRIARRTRMARAPRHGLRTNPHDQVVIGTAESNPREVRNPRDSRFYSRRRRSARTC